MHTYRLVRTGALVEAFVDGHLTVTVDSNRRNELRHHMASVGLSSVEIDQKVHELYITNATTFESTAKANAERRGCRYELNMRELNRFIALLQATEPELL